MNISKINDWMSYVLIVLLWAPHATRGCTFEVCGGPIFISPAISAFLTPMVEMDISWHGFLMQILWSMPLLMVMYVIFWLRDCNKYAKLLSIYILRWVVFGGAMILFYNLVFWGGIRDYVLPAFVF